MYLFESKEKTCDGRRELKQVFYLGGLYHGSDENRRLWKQMQEYIEANYDTHYLKAVYINGDGGSWIQTGADEIDRTVMVLDKFHMMKYINKAARLMPDEEDRAKGMLWKAIY